MVEKSQGGRVEDLAFTDCEFGGMRAIHISRGSGILMNGIAIRNSKVS